MEDNTYTKLVRSNAEKSLNITTVDPFFYLKNEFCTGRNAPIFYDAPTDS